MRIFTLKLKRSLLLLSLLIAAGQMIYAQFPVINSFNPVRACSGSGINDTLFGTNLSGAISVSYNGTGATIIYDSNDTLIAIVPNGATTGNISILTINGPASSSTVFTIDTIPAQPGPITGNTTICGGGTQTYSVSPVSGATSYMWTLPTGWTGSSTSNSISVTPGFGSGTISVTAQNECGSSPAQTLTVNVYNSPNPIITGLTNTCTGDSIKLMVGTYASYSWSTGSTVDSIYAHSSGTYSITVTDTNGCTGSASKILLFGTNLSPVISGNTSFCSGDSSLLTTGMYSNYHWSNGDTTTNNIYVKNQGTYTVTVTNGTGCTGSASVAITVNPLPTPDITPSGSTTFCQGGSVTLDAGTYSAYTWSTGSTSSSISVNASGTYKVTVTNINGCMGSDSQVVVVNALPTPIITPNGATTFCQGGSVSLDAGSSYTSYHWNNGATTEIITSNVSFNYIVTVTNSNGCSASASQTVTVNPVPVPVVSSNSNTTFCSGDSVELYTDVYSSYHWSNGATTQSFYAMNAGTYTVTVTNNFGCTATATSPVITVHSLPTVAITGATSICTGDSSLYLRSTSGYPSYMWSTGATADSIQVLISGAYTITVTDLNGCMNSVSHSVIVDSILHPSITGATAICAGTSTTLNAGMYLHYSWNSGAATTQSITRDTAGTYVVTVHNDSTCQGTDSVTVIVNPLPTPAITSNGPDTFCAGGSVTLDAGVFASYLWNINNDSVETNIAIISGNYTVTVTDANGCTKTASKTVDVIPLPPPFAIYYLSGQLFSASTTNNQWYRNDTLIVGATGQHYIPSQTGTYTDIVTINGCSTESSDSIIVTEIGAGINEISTNNHFNLFPNPNNGNFTLSYSLSSPLQTQFIIKDFVGRTVYSQPIINSSQSTIDLSYLSNGIYYWETISNNSILEKGKIAVIK